MRSEAEKKSIVKSIKLSPSQVQQIEEKANEKNMTFSSYMVDCAFSDDRQFFSHAISTEISSITLILQGKRRYCRFLYRNHIPLSKICRL